jgi:hypothetical protein
MNKTWFIHTMEYSSALKEKGNSDTYYGMNELWRYCVMLSKSVTKGQILHDHTYMRHLENSQIYWDWK